MTFIFLIVAISLITTISPVNVVSPITTVSPIVISFPILIATISLKPIISQTFQLDSSVEVMTSQPKLSSPKLLPIVVVVVSSCPCWSIVSPTPTISFFLLAFGSLIS